MLINVAYCELVFFRFRTDAAVPAYAHVWCLGISQCIAWNAKLRKRRQVYEPSQEPKLVCTKTLQ